MTNMETKKLFMYAMYTLILIPLISAGSTATTYVEGFDLFYLLVENVFGGILITGVALVICFALIGMFTKMSAHLLISLLGLFVMTYSIGYIGALAVLVFGIFSIFYFFMGIINFLNNMSG